MQDMHLYQDCQSYLKIMALMLSWWIQMGTERDRFAGGLRNQKISSPLQTSSLL